MCRSEVWFLYGLLYVVFGSVVSLGIALLEDLCDANAKWFVGIALLWPLALPIVLCRCVMEVWRWGFGRKEK